MDEIKNIPRSELIEKLRQGDLNTEIASKVSSLQLYLAFKEAGLEENGELLELLPVEQYRTMLDFEIWSKDRLKEDNVWNWLTAIDRTDSIAPLQSFIKAIDEKVLAALMCKYLVVEVRETNDDPPPGPRFYTPDNGFTWIGILKNTTEEHRLMGKILALIFDLNPDWFYHIVQSGYLATFSEFEEKAWMEREKNLWRLGIPNKKEAFQVHTKPDLQHCIAIVSSWFEINEKSLSNQNFPVVSGENLLKALLMELGETGLLKDFEDQAGEICNAAIIYFDIDFSIIDDIFLVMQKVQGCIAIGLEILKNNLNAPLYSMFQSLGLKKIYQLGYLELSKVSQLYKNLELTDLDAPSRLIVEYMLKDPPGIPEFFSPQSPVPQNINKLNSHERAIYSKTELDALVAFLNGPVEKQAP